MKSGILFLLHLIIIFMFYTVRMYSCILYFLRQKTRKEKKPNWGGNALTQKTKRDFPGGPVVENPATSAGDTSLITDCGRFNMPSNSWACGPQLLKPTCFRVRAPQQEKPPQWEACTPQLEKAHVWQWRSSATKN